MMVEGWPLRSSGQRGHFDIYPGLASWMPSDHDVVVAWETAPLPEHNSLEGVNTRQ